MKNGLYKLLGVKFLKLAQSTLFKVLKELIGFIFVNWQTLSGCLLPCSLHYIFRAKVYIYGIFFSSIKNRARVSPKVKVKDIQFGVGCILIVCVRETRETSETSEREGCGAERSGGKGGLQGRRCRRRRCAIAHPLEHVRA